MRYDSEHKESTRQRVLEEAATAIRAHGPNGIGVAGIMAKAGLTHGGFYAHFKSKDDLVAQAIAHMFEESYERFATRTADPNAVVALENYIDMYLSKRHRDAPEKGCPLPALSGELPRMPTAARKRFTEGYDKLAQMFAGRLKELGAATPERVATSMLAEMVGALALSRAIEDDAEADRILKASRDALKARLHK